MKVDVAKNIIASFDKISFRNFVIKLFQDNYGIDNIVPIENSNLIASYTHKELMYIHYYAFDYFPYNIFKSLESVKIDTENIKFQLDEIKKNVRLQNLILGDVYFISNLQGFSKEQYYKYIGQQPWQLTEGLINLDQEAGFGNIDTFFYNKEEETTKALESFIQETAGISISFNEDGYQVYECFNQNYLNSGLFPSDKGLINPVIKILSQRNILVEFQKVLNSNKESLIEQFLIEYYQDIFGNKYDNIVPQLSLKFPELDLNNKNRRLDILLRNSILEDWELFELKKDMIITTTNRGIDVFKSTVYKSIEQLRNYRNILMQDSVKRKLNEELGINYYQPEMNLLIGYKQDSFSQNSWRRLISDNSKDIKVVTYDTLYKEMENRINYFDKMYYKK